MSEEEKDITPEMQELLDEIESDPQLTEGEDDDSDEQALSTADGNSEDGKQQVVTKAKPGKYITFRLAGEDYGLYILSVKEIIGMMQVTKVPRTPDFVRGVINLRGKVHPVIELRKRFGLEEKEDDDRTPIIIVEVHQGEDDVQFIGIVVDAVSEVINVGQEDIEDTPAFGVDLDTDFILGLAKKDQKVITLLDIDKILTSRQLSLMQDLED
jgi:purine-binding chemotaxis protein CheW